MGLELKKCHATIKDVDLTGTLHVDSKELKFRNKGVLWSVKVGKGTKAKASGGILTVSRGSKSATFSIGGKAEKWAGKILNPPTRSTKLGLKSGQRYLIKGNFDSTFIEEVDACGLVVVRSAKSCDIAFVLMNLSAELKTLETIATSSSPGTHIWAVWPKGVDSICQSQVISSARKFGMGPGKGISFDDVYSAMRFTKK